jgi:hypothetical protein
MCTGFAWWRAIVTRMLRMGYAGFEDLSIPTMYAWARLFAGDFLDIDGDDIPDSIPDEGAHMSMMAAALGKWGIPHASDWPPKGMSLEEAATAVPPWDVRQKASTLKVTGMYEIDAEPGARAPLIKQAIAKGYPVVFGGPIDPAFDAWRGGNALDKIAKGRWPGHAMCIDAYEGDELIIPSSWGWNSGAGGLYRVTTDWIEDPRNTDFYVITIGLGSGARKNAEKK